MARTTCKCGEALSNHSIPNDIQLIVYTDKEWDKICTGDSIDPLMIPDPQYDVWRCPNCKRIAVYDWENPYPVMKYVLEED